MPQRGTRDEIDFVPVVKLFTPDAGATWLLRLRRRGGASRRHKSPNASPRMPGNDPGVRRSAPGGEKLPLPCVS
ncbi:DUF2958 domain-containing protein [Mesorhizobium sp. 131-2-5]|uniref:DUF2958 domain-containing protein n=1 Tax=Mesorhizobium sp. 131-2-5 TaxID=2744519 RepID=UPI001FCFAC52|nr:DUF2958 domain-containing protein [Mesorhizobium sp. 131-2-5]